MKLRKLLPVRPSNWHEQFLQKCNPTSGSFSWIGFIILGWLIMLAWMFLALPIIGTTLNIAFLGEFSIKGSELFISAYGGLYTIDNEGYFIMVFFGIGLLKIGYLVQQLGWNYITGHVWKGYWSKEVYKGGWRKHTLN